MSTTSDEDRAAPSGWMGRCVLVTPCARYDDWMALVREAVAEKGLRLTHVQDGSHHPVEGEDDRVFYSFNPALLHPAEGADRTVVLTDVATAFSGGRYLTGGRDFDCLIDTSRMLQGAVDFPRNRLVTDAAIVAAPGRRVEVLKGVWIVAPDPGDPVVSEDPLEAVASDAFRIYAEGEIQEGVEWSWPVALFEIDEFKPDRRLTPNRLPTMGPPRWLIRGPSLILPAGEWEVRARFDVDSAAAKHRYYFQWGVAEDDLRLVEFKVDGPGEHAIIVRHAWTSPGKVQLRFIVRDGSIDGEFEFLGASVRNISLR